ncbi:DUF952 domain-containing protein [Spirosoma sp. SC4-14]|uniref:DUF952 domain-containing protein n=1 Tax=Spirosoma sp. SC4-14 TaxID=3128900 RepID=UPI0030D19A80
MSLIYHVVPAKDWARFETAPMYEANSLQNEGFIHLSTESQVAGVLERYYQNATDLLLLHVDPARLTSELRYEVATNNELFPHLYGPLNKDAIVRIESIN